MDEHLFQIRNHTLNTTQWKTRTLCRLSVSLKHIRKEGECVPTH